MRWVIIYTYEFARWFEELDQPTGRAVAATIDRLSIRGPALGRPSADHVKGSRHGHMKELRVRGTIRVLFAFDPSRSAVLLLAGDKRRKADRWYDQAIPRADRIYDEYLEWLIAGGDLDGPQSAYLRWPT